MLVKSKRNPHVADSFLRTEWVRKDTLPLQHRNSSQYLAGQEHMREEILTSTTGPTLSQQLYLNSLLLVFVSLFFFIWAICNTLIKHYFDVGLVCFPFTLTTGLYSLYLLSSLSKEQPSATLTSPLTNTSSASSLNLFSTNLSRLMIFSYVLTILAYLSSVSRVPISAITYFVYCLVAMVAWAIHGFYFRRTIIRFVTEMSANANGSVNGSGKGGEFNDVTATRNSLHRTF